MAEIRSLLTLAAALIALPLPAQQQPDPANLTYEHVASQALAITQSDDPANLRGERVSAQALADTLPINHGAPALQQLLVKLRTRASMMLIVAHPDDEDGGFLTYESRGQGARVAMLTLTRGEGGQNLMSADFDDALGLIRTQELLAEDRYTGVDQYFGTEVDFGFSKTKEETLAKWTHDRVLYDAVRCVRLYRPLVLASVFVGGPTDGHGHHQVAGEITQEVFLAAANPKAFPEMGLPPWAPLKVYARVPFARINKDGMFDYATGKTIPILFHNYVTGQDSSHQPVATVTIHEGEKSRLIGMDGESYIQFARHGLSLQKTQIGNRDARLDPNAVFDSGYTLMASRLPIGGQTSGPANTVSRTSVEGQGFSPANYGVKKEGASAPGSPSPEQSIFDGIDTSLPAIANLAPSAPATLHTALAAIDAHIAEAQKAFDPNHLEQTAPHLREALRKLDELLNELENPKIDDLPTQEAFNLLHELRIKRVQLNNALVLAHNVTLRSSFKTTAALETTIHSESAHATLQNGGVETLRITRINPGFEQSEASAQVTGKASVFTGGTARMVEATAHYDQPLTPTRPYFSRPDVEQPFYDLALPALRNAPATPPPFVSSATLEDHGVLLTVDAVVPDSASAAPTQPAVLVPPVSVHISPAAGIIRPKEESFTLSVRAVGTNSEPASLKGPDGWQISRVMTEEMSRSKAERFTVKPGSVAAGKHYLFTGVVTYDRRNYTESFRPVGYPGLTYTNFYQPATYRATAVDVTTAPNLRIAFLPGTGDPIPDFLPNLGVTPAILTLKDLTPEILAKYDAVILGVRAYAAHPELAGAGSKPLMDYAHNGGVVILEYMTAKYGDAEAPYPIAVPGDSAHNVVVEAEPVQLLDPKAPLLNWPNKITSADFNNWVEERGHGFAASWSLEYQPLLETHDPEQEPQKGGLLLARVGKGAYIYCALALYRQLPEGVPGAYRLMANLLSYARNPQR